MLLLLPLLLGSLVASQSQSPLNSTMPYATAERDFKFVEGDDVLSPKNMLELPRPGAGVPNPAGDLALIAVSRHSFADKETHKSIWLAPLESTISPFEIQLAKGGEAFWLDSRTIAHIVPGEGSKGQEVYAISVKVETQSVSTPDSPKLIGAFPPSTGATNFRYSADSQTLVFSAYTWPDLDLNTIKEQDDDYEQRGHSALVYDETYPRHWDTWRGPKRSSLFTTRLGKEDQGWFLGTQYTAPLKKTGHHVPVEPFGDTGDFSVSSKHIVYTTKDPKLPVAWHTRQNVYIVPSDASSEPVELTTSEQGATHSPTISHSGSLVAWLEMAEDGYEADRNKVVLFDLSSKTRKVLTPTWDASPDSIVFEKGDKALIMTVGVEATVRVYRLPLPDSGVESWEAWKEVYPTVLTTERAASGAASLGDGKILFIQSSLTGPNELYVLEKDGKQRKITDFAGPYMKGKSLDKGESFWFEGAEGKRVHGWAVKPRGWKAGETKKWPALFLIHGGPQGAWEDQWSTRWNPNVFAQQGYFVIAINPTGSTTFGQEFTDAIAEDWGGKPFVDLQKGWQHALKTYPEINADRAVAAGASWGGYAINWIQGHPEYGFGFKALVCHDGVFDSRYNGFSTDELFFFNHEFGGTPWSKKGEELTAKFGPSNYVTNWSTPQLLIHGSKDYRLPETESIGAFNALQQKGIPTRLVVFPDENHWVLKPGNSIKWHYEVLRWFDQFVGEKTL